MADYIVHENQSLLDVSAYIYGRIDVVFELALLNNLSITEKLKSGQKLKLVDAPINNLVKQALDGRAIIPASNFSFDEISAINDGSGIDYMIIENDFIVS